MKNSEIQKLKKKGSILLLLVLFMCVLVTVVAVVLVSSPAVNAQYKDVGSLLLDVSIGMEITGHYVLY